MDGGPHPGFVSYTVPARTLTGSPQDVAAQIDDLIVTLMALRRWIVDETRPSRQRPAPRLVKGDARAWAAALVLASSFLLMGTAPASGQDGSAAATASVPSAQGAREAWRDIVFGVTLEGYFQASPNAHPDRVVALRAYDTRINSFSLQQIASVLELPPAVEKGRRYGMRLDLQAGQATEALQGSAANEARPDVYRHVWQAFGTFIVPFHRGLQVDFGKFGSNLGYETNYAKDNQAFSRAYLFNFLPYYHSGLRVSLPVTDRVTVLYMLTNGIQQTEDFNDFKSSHVSAIVRPVSFVTWTSSVFVGREQPDAEAGPGPAGAFAVVDSYVTVTLGPSVLAGIDVNRTRSEVTSAEAAKVLTGVAGYVRLRAAAATGVGFRYEHLDDEGLFGGVVQVLQEVTVTLEQKLADGLLLRGEYRRDWSNRRFFASDAGSRRAQTTWLLGAIWSVGSKADPW